MVLAYAGIMYFWNVEASPDNISHIRKGIIPFMVFIVPIMDTSFVTFARLNRGSSPFVGGKDHLTHHLAHIGIPEHLVPVTLGVISVVSGMLAIFVYKLTPEWVGFLFSIILTLSYRCFHVIYSSLSKRRKDRQNERSLSRKSEIKTRKISFHAIAGSYELGRTDNTSMHILYVQQILVLPGARGNDRCWAFAKQWTECWT